MTPRTMRVYVVCLDELEVADFRALKAGFIAHTLGLRERNVRASLKWLVQHGYLESGALDRSAGSSVGARMYRLLWTRREPPVAA